MKNGNDHVVMNLFYCGSAERQSVGPENCTTRLFSWKEGQCPEGLYGDKPGSSQTSICILRCGKKTRGLRSESEEKKKRGGRERGRKASGENAIFLSEMRRIKCSFTFPMSGFALFNSSAITLRAHRSSPALAGGEKIRGNKNLPKTKHNNMKPIAR